MPARPSSPALDALLGQTIPVLDHGFIRLIDYMGNDEAITQAARVSYGQAQPKTPEQDRALIRYLMRHRHTSPFEMCEIKLHMKMPIFVARQFIRHRTASVNEQSARYSVLDSEFYIPRPENIAVQSATNKQGRAEPLSPNQAATIRSLLSADAMANYEHYQMMLNGGLARELARMNLTLNTYTQWFWKTDLHNLLHFLSLRADPHAQYEIRVYAEAMLDLVRKWVPITYEAFLEYRLNAETFSATMLATLRTLLAGKPVGQASSGLTKREWDDMMGVLK